jgi:hypothetical protein
MYVVSELRGSAEKRSEFSIEVHRRVMLYANQTMYYEVYTRRRNY